MSIQAIIMAGGAGTRLLPLTCRMPKPLAPLCGAPLMDYSLRLLRRHGFREAQATLWYRPQDVQRCFGPGRHGVDLRYVVEDKPVGTAGSVRMAAGDCREPVLVLSGDGLTNIDLTALLAFHRSRGAAATLALTRVDVPLAYGVVVTAKDGRIKRFIEKPDWSRVISSLVNTGVYVLSPEALRLIPADKPFDFGKELFPQMLEKGLPLYGYESDAYWCDVGNPAAFLKAQGDLLAGRTGFEPADRGLQAAENAFISADSYVAPGVRIGWDAQIRRSCVLEGAVIGPGAQLEGAIVCANARVERGAVLHPGSVLGAGSAAGAYAVLGGRAKIWPGVSLAEDSLTDTAVRESAPAAFSGGVARGEPALWAAAFRTLYGPDLTVMYATGAEAVYHLALGALALHGAERVEAMGRGSLGMLRQAMETMNTPGGLLCRREGILFLGAEGLPLSDREQAALETAVRRQEFSAPVEAPAAPRFHASFRRQYLRNLTRRFAVSPGAAFALSCGDRFLSDLAREAAEGCGHQLLQDGSLTLRLREDTAEVLLFGKPLPVAQQFLLCARALRFRDKPAYALPDLPLENAGLLPWDGGPECLEQARLLGDGVGRMLLLLSLFARETPEQALSALPRAALRQIAIPCEPGQKGRVLESLLHEAAPRRQGGLSACHGDARAVIRPDPALPLLHVAVSAGDAENAQELCDFYAGRVMAALRQAENGLRKK